MDSFQIVEMEEEIVIPVERADKRYFSLGRRPPAERAAAEPRGLISDVVMQDAAMHVYLRSVVQVDALTSIDRRMRKTSSVFVMSRGNEKKIGKYCNLLSYSTSQKPHSILHLVYGIGSALNKTSITQ